MMKKIILSAVLSCFAVAMAMGLPTTARAAIADDLNLALAAHPDCDSGLAAAIAGIITGAGDPALAAQDLLDAAASLELEACQLTAIGTGIGQAANIVGLTDPALFARIAGLITGSTREVQTAFDIATGSPTGAIDPTAGLLIGGPGPGGPTASEN